MTKVAVILSGCGVFDGSEIHESVLTLFNLDSRGIEYQCLAPNIDQMHVINHLTGEEIPGETRNVLIESARIARGEVLDLATGKPEDYDALIIPGGFGAAKNLCDFAVAGADCSLLDDVLNFSQAMHNAGKPIGLMCIAPAMSARIFGKGVECTIGNDQDTAQAIEAMGAKHIECPVAECHVDKAQKLVTTPAYMLADGVSEAGAGISRLVEEVLALI